MDDSRRRTTSRTMPLLAGVIPAVAALMSGCGGNAPSSDAPPTRVSGGSRIDELERSKEKEAPAVQTTLDPTVGQLPVEAPSGPSEAPIFACNRDPVAFDLSALQPTRSTPPGFWYAWKNANRNREVPGFVVAYSQTRLGPRVQATVGSVYQRQPGTYSFMEILPHLSTVVATLDPRDPLRVQSFNDGQIFATAFGTVHNREGFKVSRIAIQGRLDQECRALHDVNVEMYLPASNVGQNFGNSTVERELGPMTVRDSEGKLDGWTVSMTAPAIEGLRFRP